MEFSSILTVSQAHGSIARPLASRERADDHLGVLAHPSLNGPGLPKVLPKESVMVIFCLLARHLIGVICLGF